MPDIRRLQKQSVVHFFVTLLLIGAAAAFGVCSVFAQPASSAPESSASRPYDPQREEAPKTISFRRWFAPMDGFHDWPYGQGQYMELDRRLFEQWVAELAQPQDDNRKLSAESPFTQIVLYAKWKDGQLVNGTGSIRLQPFSDSPLPEKTSGTRRCSFDSPSFWMDSAKLEDGTPVPLTGSADGKLHFVLPAADAEEDKTVLFNWSQRGRVYAQQGTAFDFTFPPCPATELRLLLPESLTPTLSGGIVQEEPLPEQEIQGEKKGMKRWRIFFGRKFPSTLIVAPQRKNAAKQLRTGVRQTLVYNIAPKGTDIRSTFVFDKTGTPVSHLVLDLDPTLRLVEVLYGDQRVSWSPYFSDDLPSGTGIVINLSPVSRSEQQELTLRAVSSVNEPLARQLPHIRIASDNVFWQETRCHLVVQNPYKVQAVETPQAVRISSVSSAEQTDREVLTFQFFEADAAVLVQLADSQPKVTFNSAAQALLGNNDIQGTVTVDAVVTGGSSYVLTLPLSPDWVVDSVKSVYRLSDSVKTADVNEIAFWDIVEGSAKDSADSAVNSTLNSHTQPIKTGNNALSLQLKQPLLPEQVFRFRITGRCPIDTEQTHRLSEVVPLTEEIQKQGTHLLAIQSVQPFYLQYRSDTPLLSDKTDSLTRLFQSFDETPQGTVVLLDAPSRETPFEITRLKPNYTAEISEHLAIQEKELILSCTIQCRPFDSSVDRIYVHFTDEQKLTFPDRQQTSWQWSSSSDLVQFHRLTAEEQHEISASPDTAGGEMWEIRFASPQILPFEIKGTVTIPLMERFIVPLASVPLAASQKGTVTVDSPHPEEYRILNTSLYSSPLTTPKDTQYQTLRGAFRYEPAERQPSALTLQRFRSQELPPTAWAWILHLHSQYDSEGFVRNNAVFLLENQGRSSLQVTLPNGVTVADVRKVLQNGQRVSCRSGPKMQDNETLMISMPENERFVSLSLEYVHQDAPLIQQQHLTAKYPTVDIPILSRDWTVWFPSGFEAVQQFHPVSSGRTEKYFGLNSLFSILPDAWKQTLNGSMRRSDAEDAVSVFFRRINDKLNGIGESSTSKVLVWADLVGNEKELSDALNESQKEYENTVTAKIFIDKYSLAMLGIQPDSPLKMGSNPSAAELFEQSGLMVLVALKTTKRNKEYSFYITSAFLCALRQQFHSQPLDSTACYFPEDSSITVAHTGVEENSFFSPNSSFGKTQEWVAAPEWNQQNSPALALWTLPPQMLPTVNSQSGWNVFEVPQDAGSPLYFIHRPTYTAYHFLAFLLTVVLTFVKRFSHPLLLLFLMLLSGIGTYCVPPCYAGILYGIFLGVTVSLGFVLIRSRRTSLPFAQPYYRIYSETPIRSDSTISHTFSSADHTVGAQNTAPPSSRTILTLLMLTLGLSFCLGFAANVQGQEPVSKTPVPAKNELTPSPETSETEPYRVFYPIDEKQRIVGETIWLPMDFLNILSQQSNALQNTTKNWSIERAEYEGTFAYRPQTQLLELSDDFKAVYDIHLNVGKTTLVLPPLPLRQEHVLWDDRPVPVKKHVNKEGKDDSLLLSIENETVGKHRLVLPLLPKQELFNTQSSVSIDIPKVPNAVLRLKTPQDAPSVRVTHSLGAVIPNSLEGTTLTAQIGPSEKLAFSWNSEAAGNNVPLLEVDQFFQLSARTTQVEMRAVFRLQIGNGAIRQLQIQTDPRWRRSGQFYCAEVPIDSAEPLPNIENNNVGAETEQNEITRIVFQKPASGTVTLEAGFVFHDFNGIGKIRLPQFKTLNARINRSVLAVFADSRLQLDYPKAGLSADWLNGKMEPSSAQNAGSQTSSSPFSPIKRSEPTAVPSVSTENEFPIAEYDLSKVDASWVLAVRAKKPIPILNQHQSVLLDDGYAAVLCRNEFQSASEVFQQRFLVPKGVEIESVTVLNAALNAEKNPIEIRWGKIKEAFKPPTAGPQDEYNIFFTQPVSGKYSIVIHGRFPTPVKEKLPVPQLTFSDVYIKNALLTLFRTPSVMAALTAEESVWISSDTLPAFPAIGYVDSRQIPLRSYQWMPPDSRNDASVVPPLALSVQLSPNRPEILGDQMLTLRRNVNDWELTLDSLWDITDGECYTVSFVWDARCSSILSVEPPMPHSIRQEDGQTLLTLSPTAPLSGRQHIKIKAVWDATGTSLSIPRLALQPPHSALADIRRFLILPKYDDGTLIPWSYALLAQADAETLEYLKSTTHTTDADFLFLHTLGDNYFASIVQEKKNQINGFFDINFFVQKDGILYGMATIDLKHREQGSFTLYLPDGYELIQFSSGSVSKGIKISKNRWKFDLWNSDYPHRLHIIFRGIAVSTSLTKNDSPFVLKFPLLEGISAHQTVWTVSLLSAPERSVAPFSVTSVREDLFGFPPTALSQELSGETVTDLGRCVPVDETHSIPAQLKFNIIRLDNLLKVFDSVSTPSTTFKTEEGKRWLALWSKEWNRIEKSVEKQLQNLPASAPEKPILRDDAGKNSQTQLPEYIWTILESNNVPPLFQALKQNHQNKTDKILAAETNTEQMPIHIPNVSFYGLEKTRNMFGISDGSIKELHIQPLPNTSLWTSGSSGILLLCLVLPLPLLLLSRKNLLTDLFFQFPYFWGTAAALLFWSFYPSSLIGQVLVLLILLSFFYPVWKKHREINGIG